MTEGCLDLRVPRKAHEPRCKGHAGRLREAQQRARYPNSAGFKLPPRGLLLRLLCVGQSYAPGTGVILGRVLDPDGAPAPKLGVQASWASNPNEKANVLKEVETRDNGHFAMCGVPLGQDVRVRASTRHTAGDVVVHIRDNATPVLLTLRPRG